MALSAEKKVLKHFRLRKDLCVSLADFKAATGMGETATVEAALDIFFAEEGLKLLDDKRKSAAAVVGKIKARSKRN